MHALPFDKPGRFWRGNLHTHSTASDGRLTPEETCRFYRDNGYDFLAITDHFLESYGFPVVDTRPFRTADFCTLTGAELHAGQTQFGQLWHILAVGLPLDFAPSQNGENGPEIAARALEAGAYVAVAHPNWYNLTIEDALSLGPVDAIEVFNGIAIDHNDKADSWMMLDNLLERGHRYTACATDDAHFKPERFDAMRGWVHVKAEALEPELLLAALKAGHYYSSTGPQLHNIQIFPGDRIIIDCSPVERVYVTGSGYQSVFTSGNGLTRVELPLERIQAPYCRVTIRDTNGGRAWSNPIWFDGTPQA